MLADRRAKIVATIGPSTADADKLEKAIRAGMNVARLNFSHGSHEDHVKVLKSLREISKRLQAPITILQDLQGPKIRVGKFKDGKITLTAGQIVTITVEEVEGSDALIPSDFKELPEVCKIGTKILLDDGLLELQVIRVSGQEVIAQVIYGGILKNRKGMNLPGVSLPVDCMTEKDLQDLEFGLANGVDYVALSFVRHAKDIRQLRGLIEEKNSSARIIAKIEMLEALDNLEDICRASDAVMVARGDLAVEVGQSRLPGIQKRIIKLCNELLRKIFKILNLV
jgi:pyruvate kinase